jgi:alpha-tubulin suppressor-like RCC1 family protein
MTRRFRASMVAAAAPFFLFGCTAILGNFDVADGPATTSPEAGNTDAPSTTGDGGNPEGGADADAGVVHLQGIGIVTAGAQHTCALTNDPTKPNDVYCWGHNGSGQLGQPVSVARSGVPVKVPLPAGTVVTDLVAGAFHTCAIVAGGDMYCWGQNECGQVGAGDVVTPSLPRKVLPPVGSVPKWISAGPGEHHTCAVDSSGTTYCWGCAGGLVLGSAAGTPPLSTPVTAGAEKSPAKLISASPLFNCIVNTSGQLACWGSESAGELGNGDPPGTQTSYSNAVFPVLGGTTSASAITTGAIHTCIIDQDKAITCWGDNSAGELGIATQTSTPGPKVLAGNAKANRITAGNDFTCYTNATDLVFCMGTNAHGELGRGGVADNSVHVTPDNVLRPDSATGGFRSISIAAGRGHACAVRFEAPNEVVCWGDGTDGQLGDGTVNGGPKTTPVFVVPPK